MHDVLSHKLTRKVIFWVNSLNFYSQYITFAFHIPNSIVQAYFFAPRRCWQRVLFEFISVSSGSSKEQKSTIFILYVQVLHIVYRTFHLKRHCICFIANLMRAVYCLRTYTTHHHIYLHIIKARFYICNVQYLRSQLLT